MVDLVFHAEFLAGDALADARLGIVEPRRGAQRGQLIRRQALAAHLAQHVELALANEVVATFALDHGLELGLFEIELAALVLARIQLGPLGRRVGDKAHNLAEKTFVLFRVGHGGARVGCPGGVVAV